VIRQVTEEIWNNISQESWIFESSGALLVIRSAVCY
jgi:hypothetical protein